LGGGKWPGGNSLSCCKSHIMIQKTKREKNVCREKLEGFRGGKEVQGMLVSRVPDSRNRPYGTGTRGLADVKT